MRHVDQLINTMLRETEGVNRRSFLSHTGRSIMAATILGELSYSNSAQGHNGASPTDKDIHPGSDKTPIELTPLNNPTELKTEPLFTPLPPEKRIGFAIVGLGNLSLGQILPAFAKSKYAKPVALVSGSPAKAQKVARQYGINPQHIYDYKNFDDIRNNKEIDAVYIVLPNGMHEEFTIRGAKAGKHVLCEKPMANTVAEAERMVAACDKAGKKLMIAYRIQYEPHHRMAKDWVRTGEYGKVKLIEAVNTQNIGDPNQWRLKKALSGGGSLPDIGLYCLNTTRYMLGEEPEMVTATTFTTPGDERFTEVEETVLFQLRFPGGAMANCSTSYGVHESRRYRCHGDKGGWFGLDPAFPYKGLKMEVEQAKDKVSWKQAPSMGEHDQFALELDHMAQCIQEDKKPYTPGEEGLQDMRIMAAIYEAAATGKPVMLQKSNTIDAFRGTDPKSFEAKS